MLITDTLFNGPFSGTTRVNRHQKDKTNLDFTDNHASTPPLTFYKPDALPASPTNSVKPLKAKIIYYMLFIQYNL